MSLQTSLGRWTKRRTKARRICCCTSCCFCWTYIVIGADVEHVVVGGGDGCIVVSGDVDGGDGCIVVGGVWCIVIGGDLEYIFGGVRCIFVRVGVIVSVGRTVIGSGGERIVAVASYCWAYCC